VPFVPGGFFVRGAKSIDEGARTAGHDWWPEEELNWKQSKQALDEYINVEPKHVFSHDAPQQAAEVMFASKDPDPTNTSKLLQEMFDSHSPKTWTFGHWHRNVTAEVGGTTFQCLGELETTTLEFMSHHE
jgi:hypothetical protein